MVPAWTVSARYARGRGALGGGGNASPLADDVNASSLHWQDGGQNVALAGRRFAVPTCWVVAILACSTLMYIIVMYVMRRHRVHPESRRIFWKLMSMEYGVQG